LHISTKNTTAYLITNFYIDHCNLDKIVLYTCTCKWISY